METSKGKFNQISDNNDFEGKSSLMRETWDIKTRLRLKKEPGHRTYERITIGSYSMVKFFNLIRPYIAPSMKYKILDPLTTQSMRRVGKA